MDTPQKIPGFDYNDVSGVCSNWKKCWSKVNSEETDPYLILLADDTLWVVPAHVPGDIWGADRAPMLPKPIPDTTGWLGLFDSFEEGWTTFVLSLKE